MDTVTPERLMEVFSGNVRRLRRDLGLSQQQLADRIAKFAPYVSDLERGKRYPRPLELARLADALETTPDTLFRETEEKVGSR